MGAQTCTRKGPLAILQNNWCIITVQYLLPREQGLAREKWGGVAIYNAWATEKWGQLPLEGGALKAGVANFFLLWN